MAKQGAAQAQGSTNISLVVAPRPNEEVRTLLVDQGVDDPAGASSKKRERARTNSHEATGKAIPLSDGESDLPTKKVKLTKDGRKSKSPRITWRS